MAYRSDVRTETIDVPIDPFIGEKTGFSTYRSEGLRESVRGVMSSPPGSALAVSLPTGAGKTTVFLAPALWDSAPGLTLVVVPTVALALDLEARLRAMPALESASNAGARYAYVGGMPRAEKEEVRRRIRTGTQRVVFAAPESVLASLRPSLHDAAAKGSIRRLVLDEAHLVSQWGDSFRPAYQHLAVLWRTLAKANAQAGTHPSLIFLSATFTDYSLAVIGDLFCPDQRLSLVGQLALRPEHEYWLQRSESESRDDSVIDALAHTPRPALLYTTKRSHADALYLQLATLGYRRIALFTGATSANDRQRIIDQWRSDGLDLVVATSAFGLGVDKADVRAVIHATVPESLDRYYQEVGRAGRDGKGAMALMLWTKLDKRIARRLAAKQIVTSNLARRRWRAMLDQATASKVDVRATRPSLLGDSDLNQYWNLQVLQLMCRAGFIELMAEPLPRADSELTDDAWQEWYSTIRVDILRGDLATDDPWSGEFEAVRRQISEAAHHGIAAMEETLAGRGCLGEHLVRIYRLTDEDWWVEPTLACGGCPSCRRIGRPARVGASPPFRHRLYDPRMSPLLKELVGTNRPLIVRLDPSDDGQPDIVLLERLVAHGVRHLLVPTSWADRVDRSQRIREKAAFVDSTERFRGPTPTLLWSPSCVVAEPEMPAPTLRDLLDGSVGVDLLVVSADHRDPRHSARALCEMVPSIPASQVRNI